MLLTCKDKLPRNMSKRRSYDNNPQSTFKVKNEKNKAMKQKPPHGGKVWWGFS